MFALIHSLTFRRLLLEQAPVLIVSFLIAEIFYKFGSFSLECIAFLATWYVFDGTIGFVRKRLRHSLPADT